MAKIGSSDLDVSRLCLGGNVFGWTADRDTSFAILDAYVAAGGNFIDTSDSYMWRIPGNSGGESETIIGQWTAARGNRDDVVIATKVSSLPARPGLSKANITAAVEDSLRRLQTDRIDLYYAHKDDPDVAQEETLDAFDGLLRAGKVRALGASNFTAERLRSALEISARDGLAAYVALQPHYNLLERAEFETELAPLLASEAETTTASGIVIPDTAKEKPQEGKVLAVGPGRVDDNGNRVPLDVAVGDVVIYSKYGGTEVKYNGEEYLILSARDVLAVVN